MLERLLLPFIVVSALLLVLFGALVVSKRLSRSYRERVSRQRRARYSAVLREGSGRELRALGREVRDRRAAQDLAVVLGAESRSLPSDRRACVQRALRTVGLEQQLISDLGSRSAIKRGRAALLTGRLQLPHAVPALRRLLFDPDPDVQQAALSGIALGESEEAGWALLRALRGEAIAPEWIVDRLGYPWAVDVLLAAFRSELFRAVRPRLAEALGLAGDSRASNTLAALLVEGDDEERVSACRALRRIGCGTKADVLIEALSDPFWPVRAQAARGLAGVEHDRALDRLVESLGDQSWWVRAHCAETLRSTAPGIAALKRALSSADRFARDRAAEALAVEAAAVRAA